MLRPIISDDPTVNRYQCGNIDCMRNFSTPKPGFGPSPFSPREGEEEAKVAKLKCSKCDKPYKHQARLETHEAACNGIEGGKPERKPRATKAAKPAGGLMDSVVAMLQDKRTERIALLTSGDHELEEIDRVLAALGATDPT